MSVAAPARVSWLDNARGIAIVLVVMAHVWRGLRDAGLLEWTPFHQVADFTIYAFHMPAFFFLAGLTTPHSLAKGRGPFLYSKIKTVAYPYLLWSLLQGGVMVALSRYTSGKVYPSQLLTIPWHPIAQFWFLFTLMAFQLLVLALGTRLLFWLALPAFVVAGLFLSYETTAFNLGHFLLFYAAGAAFSESFMALPARIPLLAAAAAFAVLAAVSNLLGMDYHNMSALPLAVTGIALTCVLGLALGKTRAARAMTVLGQYSMSIYVMHILVTSGARIALHKMHVPIGGEGMLLIGTVLGIAIPIAAHILLMRLNLLWIFGLGKKRAAPAVLAREQEIA
ncbi:acyltransferase [Novosphingobium sp. SG720]|uniref:acyltransferase family protein n=1 Tax=Novosphingobium sp. SG720 TaxID=2586998 RepID=UPI0014480C6B|nr:acyltransferase [Novosphingobium sp. SG720]NKJ43257.1 fucose 4-O-acetylase-like acetyltransferase [Novosphingobium sp. SG720]